MFHKGQDMDDVILVSFLRQLYVSAHRINFTFFCSLEDLKKKLFNYYYYFFGPELCLIIEED